MGKYIFFLGMGIFLLFLFCGCYQYKPPAPVLLSPDFNATNRTATDAILTQTELLTIPEAKRIAELNNQNYLAAYHSVHAARMRYYQALGAFSPEIHIGNQVGQPMNWANNMTNPPMDVAGREIGFRVNSSVTASWLLFDGLARYLTTKAAESEFKKEAAVQMRVLCMLKRAVAYAYFDLQLARELQSIQKSNIAFQDKMYGLIKKQKEEGKRPEDEVLNFQILAGVGQNMLTMARYQEKIADYSLSQLMGYSEGELPRKVQYEPIPNELELMYYSEEMCIEIALRNSPDMHIMEQMLKVAEYNKYRSYSAFFPTVYADASYGNTQMSAQYRDFRNTHSSFNQNSMYYGIRSDLLIFDGFARYNKMREMQTLFAVAQFNLADTYLQIINAIRSAYAGYKNAYEQVQVYKKLIPSAIAQRDLVLENYMKHAATVDRMDFAQRYWVDIQTQLAVCITDFNKAIAQLEAIMMIDVYTKDAQKIGPVKEVKLM